MKTYHVVTVKIHQGTSDAEDLVYVAEASVTADHILSGNDEGVVCLCLMSDKAQLIAQALSGDVQKINPA